MSTNIDSQSTAQVETMRLRDYLSDLGPSAIASMVVIGSGTILSVLGAASEIGPSVGWILPVAFFGMYAAMAMAAKTTTHTGKPPFELLADIWRPLVLIFGFLAIVPQVLIIMVQGLLFAQVGEIITGIDAKIIIWPLLLLTAWVFFFGNFPRLKNVSSILVFLMTFIALIFGVRMLFGPGMSVGAAFSGLVIPKWPDHPMTAYYFAAIIGGAGNWVVLAYQGYSIVNNEQNKPRYLNLLLKDALIFGFGVCGLFALGYFWAAAGAFHPLGIVPETVQEAGSLFVPVLGKWSYILFYFNLFLVVFTTIAGGTIFGGSFIFGVLRAYSKDKEKFDPRMEKKNFKILLFALLFVFSILGTYLGGPMIFPYFLWGLSLLSITTPPAFILWFYLTNSPKYAGENRNGLVFNILLATFIILVTYVGIKAAPNLLNLPFLK